MKEEGIVIKIENGDVVIETKPKEVCTKCCSCGAGRPQRVTISGEKAKGLKEGDRVEVEVETGSMMKVYLLLYGLPLAIFVGTVLVLYAVSNSPLISFFGGAAGTVITYFFVGYFVRKNQDFIPDICVRKPL